MNRFTKFTPGSGLILDPTCGPASWWKEFPAATVVKCDLTNRTACDVQSDARHLPFQEAVFSEIWCDPPHLIRNDVKHWNPSYLRYGFWPYRHVWENFLDSVNAEFARALQPGGRLLMKIIHGKDRRVTHREDLDRLTRWKVTGEEVWKSGASWSTCTSHLVEFDLR